MHSRKITQAHLIQSSKNLLSSLVADRLREHLLLELKRFIHRLWDLEFSLGTNIFDHIQHTDLIEVDGVGKGEVLRIETRTHIVVAAEHLRPKGSEKGVDVGLLTGRSHNDETKKRHE